MTHDNLEQLTKLLTEFRQEQQTLASGMLANCESEEFAAMYGDEFKNSVLHVDFTLQWVNAALIGSNLASSIERSAA